MTDKDQRFREYYITETYKGFQKIRDNNYKLLFTSTHLTFSNGQKDIFASCHYKEEALINIFNKIDGIINN